MIDGDIRELYQEVILDHSKNPRNYRHLDQATCTAQGNNPLCGDRLTVYLKLGGGQLIEDATFEGRGCAISMASASMMTEIVCGKTVSQVQRLFSEFRNLCTSDVEDAVSGEFEVEMDKLRVMSGVRQFPMRVKCATLSWHAINAAITGDSEASTE